MGGARPYTTFWLAKHFLNTFIFLFSTAFLASCADTNPSPTSISYTVTFDVDGGSVIASVTVEQGAKLTRPTNPTKAGYVFVDWFKDAAKTEVFNFSTETITQATTIYAKWEKQKYTVTFDVDGGSAVASVVVEQGAKLTKPTNPTKAGYVFVDWFKDAAKAEVFNFDAETITQATTIYAKWEAAYFTPSISWRGIRAVELQISAIQSAAVAFIVRVATEAAPTYADVETNIALQSRSVTSGTHYFYTALHYASNQALSSNINALVAGDYLTAGTAYKAHVFQDKNLVSSLDFSTLALPAATDWDETKQFIDGTFPYRSDTYQIDVQEGSVLLMPVYWKELIDLAVIIVRPTTELIASCASSSEGGGDACLSVPGYALVQSFEHTTVAANTYFSLDFGIQQFATIDFVAPNVVENGKWTFKVGERRLRQVTVNMH